MLSSDDAIAYTSIETGINADLRLYSITSAGTLNHNFTQPPAFGISQTRHPEWSPNRQFLAYDCRTTEFLRNDLCVALVDQNGQQSGLARMNTDSATTYSGASWSLDSQYIAYFRGLSHTYDRNIAVSSVSVQNGQVIISPAIRTISNQCLSQLGFIGSPGASYWIASTPPDWGDDNYLYFSVTHSYTNFSGMYRVNAQDLLSGELCSDIIEPVITETIIDALVADNVLNYSSFPQMSVNGIGEVAFDVLAPNGPAVAIFRSSSQPTIRIVYELASGAVWSPDGDVLAFTIQATLDDPPTPQRLVVSTTPHEPELNLVEIPTTPQSANPRFEGGYYYYLSISWASLPTPPPTPTPSPTPTLSPQEEFYQDFAGIIFWAIYNESNANEQIPFSEAITSASVTIPNTLQLDHRYVMARLILANIPLYDYGSGVQFMQRWGGSIGNPDYRLWGSVHSGCEWEGSSIGTYQAAIVNGSTEILRWMRGSVECFRQDNPLENSIVNFDNKYSTIFAHIEQAISDQLNGVANLVGNAKFVKHTSSCFVWHRDENGYLTGCRGDQGRIDMRAFCAEQPNRPNDPNNPTNRNCRVSDQNPGNIDLINWFTVEQIQLPNGQIVVEGQYSNQQLGLDTVVGRGYQINLGFYTPDTPIQQTDGSYVSGQGCNQNCYFLIGNPFDNLSRRFTIQGENIDQAWGRHEQRYFHPSFGYKPNGTTYYVHVLRRETIPDPGGGEIVTAETWITYAFQS